MESTNSTITPFTNGVQTIEQGARGLIPEYLGSIDAKPRTIEAYGRNLRHYFDWLESSGRSGDSAADVRAYREHLIGTYSPATASAYLSAVRGFYAWLQETQRYPDIAARVHGPKKPRGFAKDALTPSQVRTVLAGIDRTTPEGRRDYALVNLMVRTGLRTIEVSRADVGDIRQQGEATVLYIQGKGRDSKDDFVILTPEALAPIMAYVHERGAGLRDPLFSSMSNRDQGGRLTTRSISRIVKGAMLNVGIDSERLTAHSLRHTAVTLALMGGADIQQAQAMARHANIQTTEIYAHNIDRINMGAELSVARALEGLRWPR